MPRIIDNIDQSLLPALRETLNVADRADFCVGCFNLRGWKRLDPCGGRARRGETWRCHPLICVNRQAHQELRKAQLIAPPGRIESHCWSHQWHG